MPVFKIFLAFFPEPNSNLNYEHVPMYVCMLHNKTFFRLLKNRLVFTDELVECYVYPLMIV